MLDGPLAGQVGLVCGLMGDRAVMPLIGQIASCWMEAIRRRWNGPGVPSLKRDLRSLRQTQKNRREPLRRSVGELPEPGRPGSQGCEIKVLDQLAGVRAAALLVVDDPLVVESPVAGHPRRSGAEDQAWAGAHSVPVREWAVPGGSWN